MAGKPELRGAAPAHPHAARTFERFQRRRAHFRGRGPGAGVSLVPGPRTHCRSADPGLLLPIERDDFSSNRHLALFHCWSMIPRVEPEGMLFRKPVSTPDQVRGRLFRDHALINTAWAGGS